MTAPNSWHPAKEVIEGSNIHQVMLHNGFERYTDFWKWSVEHKEEFWEQTISNLGINFDRKYKTLLDLSQGEEKARWIPDARMNIVDSCFQNDDSAIALVFQEEGGELTKVRQKELQDLVNRVANSMVE